MSLDNGYIKLFRDIRQHWVWDDPEILRAWIDLIMMANYESRDIWFNGRIIRVERGSFITSVRKLSERWHWSRGRVMRFLEILERDAMITTKRDTQKTAVTIVNWELYQGDTKKNGTRSKPRIKHQTVPQTEPQTEHNEEYKKNIKEGKEYKAPQELEEGDRFDEDGWEDA